MRECQGIGRRSGRDQEHGDLVIEDVGKALLNALGPGIVAIAERKAVAGLRDRRHDLRRDRRGIVAGEIHARSK